MKSISKDMIKSLKTGLTLAVIVFTLGCFSKHPSYPISWPQTTGLNDIESRIEGSFYCSGETIESNMGLWDMKSITDFLIGGLNSPTCDYVEIRKVQPDEMEIRFINYRNLGVEFMKRIYKKNRDYHVEDNWIVLKPCVSWGGEDAVFARGSVTPHLTIDVEQGLVIKAKNTTAGIVFLVIPIGSSGTDWGRFNRKK
jgi:hypothetical protein